MIDDASMARPLRLEFPGALYHVTARGNERKPIFREDQDRRRFLERLAQVARTHRRPLFHSNPTLAVRGAYG